MFVGNAVCFLRESVILGLTSALKGQSDQIQSPGLVDSTNGSGFAAVGFCALGLWVGFHCLPCFPIPSKQESVILISHWLLGSVGPRGGVRQGNSAPRTLNSHDAL
ncbi:hypothetical protein XENTR_v10013220 [Xenopus tropicalis]|nr:hypothetical protein XENTR_v10013220 [Xenopus tropicalis]